MNDLLSSASLLLTFIAILYGLWYPEIKSSLETKILPHPEDRVKDYQKVKETLYKRALPLAIASVALALVFTPDTIHIILLSLSHTQHKGWKAFFDYNAVSASLALITFATALFACHLLSLVFKLINLKRRLDPRN